MRRAGRTDPVNPQSYAALTVAAGSAAEDSGPLAHARQLEGAGYVHMAIQPGLGGTCASALKVIS